MTAFDGCRLTDLSLCAACLEDRPKSSCWSLELIKRWSSPN
jgi:hypothetical protein